MEQMNRQQVPVENTWKLEDIFATDDAWENAYSMVDSIIANLAERFQGKLHEKSDLLEMCRQLFDCNEKAEAVYVYARMRRDEDNNVTKYQGMTDKAQSLMVELETVVSFIAPELLSYPAEYLQECIADSVFAPYRMYLDEIERNRKHTLSAEEERIIAVAGEVTSSPSTIYDMLTDADMKFPEITDEDGEKVEITHANFIPHMMSKDRNVRKAAFEALYSTFKSFSATIPAIYAASVKSDIFGAKTGKFSSALESCLYPDAIPVAVYDNLIEAVHKHLPGLSRLVRHNGEMIGLQEMHMYDVYTPATKGFDICLPYSEAYDLVIDCLGVLGKDYQEVLRRAKNERWIDPFPNVGKSSGAYSWGTYGSHPYVLLNYHEDLDGLQTIAHEMGHSLHTWYSSKAQPYSLSEYSLFVAEVASTVNEVLVLLELLERYPPKDAQAYLLYNLLDSYRTTLFRQTMFAEFEKISHNMAENGIPLNAESLNKEYAALNAKYYEGIVQDEEIAYEWMRIPHFYRAFYVYKYATGFSAAMAIASRIRKEGAPAVEGYKKFLSAGCSLYPIEALKLAGIDMSKPEPVENALNMFEELLEKYISVTQ